MRRTALSTLLLAALLAGCAHRPALAPEPLAQVDETVQRYMSLLPEHLVRRFIAKEENAVLVTGRLPDVDASQILPVVEKIDKALDDLRKERPEFRISVTGLPAIAARNSARMISQLNEALPLCVAFAGVLLAIAFRPVFVGGDTAQIVLDWSIDGTGPDGEIVHMHGTASDIMRRGADGFWRYIIDNNQGTAVRHPS